MGFKDLPSNKKKSSSDSKDCQGGDCVSTEFSKELSPKTASKDDKCK